MRRSVILMHESILIPKIVGEIYDVHILHTITSTATEIDYVEHSDDGC
jgi:hypothetical protein